MNRGFYFDHMVMDAEKKLQLILPSKDSNNNIVPNPNTEFIAWEDYSDNGNACYDPLKFDSEDEKQIDALWLAAVRTAMPYGSDAHKLLMPEVAKILGNNWVTYDWLTKACGRVFNGCSFDELKGMVELSRTVKEGMKRKGLSMISSISEALA